MERWWQIKGDEVCSAITTETTRITDTQVDGYEKFYLLARLYDPTDPLVGNFFPTEYCVQPTENICAAHVDTVSSMIARTKVRPVFLTDEGDWATKRRANDLGRYMEGLVKQLKLHEMGPRIFKDSAIFGTGLVRFEIDKEGKLSLDRFLPTEVRVNEAECVSQAPRQLHLVKSWDRDELMLKYPAKADELESAQTSTDQWLPGIYGGYDQVMVRESWRLPVGTKGQKGYRPGRKVVSTTTLVLLDEEYHDTKFPIAVLRWNTRTTGFMGAGLVESLVGYQRTLNKQNEAMDVQIDLHASPVTYVNIHDIALLSQAAQADFGTIVPYKVEKPQTVMPPVISPSMQWRHDSLVTSSKELSGISNMHSHAEVPARLESGAAIRELNDVGSERFSLQEQAYERWFLDCIEVICMLVKFNASAGYKTPDIGFAFAHIAKRIKWGDVDLKDITYQLQAAPILSRTLAGRYQQIADWANQGLITPESARHLINHPDLDSEMSLYDSYVENIDKTIEILLDGEFVPPDPRGYLRIGLDRVQQAYFKAQNDGAPEEYVELMRTWLDQGVFILSKSQPPPQAAPQAPQQAPLPQAA